ncbi:MAG: Stk1 family PASTA domain-containing Ser/Thr kinase [Propionibacteriaceae bacterium]|jgi:serine/threonine-protein kinase|nr:Stk1 family PASTA domain-containing Ser/Thr kinase [Propionibacteriaceae bacterium]
MTENLLGDRYIVGPLLGRGGMAEVRRGRDIRLERDVAIKRLRPDLAGDAIFQARFRREAQAAAGLNHPNIVSVYDTGEQFDSSVGFDIPYIVMELVIGHTLRDVLRDGRKIQPERALELTTSVLNAIDYSHRHGIIHRDIKPANVMVTTNGQVKVMDFGIARAVSDTAASMTQTAAVIGTPQYLSPEQIRGETVDRRADVYATGCLLYELLAGRPPFQGDEPVSLAYQHVRERPIPPSQVDPVVTPEMDAIVLKALQKDPADRYQTAKEMADDIARLLAGQQVTALIPLPAVVPGEAAGAGDPTRLLTSSSVPQPVIGSRGLPPDDADEAEETRSHKGLIALIVSLSVVLVALAVGLLVYINRPVDPPAETTVEVPYVQGMTQENAEQTIAAVQLNGEPALKVEVEHENGPNDDSVGKVIRQSPRAKEKVEKDTTITIVVNDGPKKVILPTGLIGLDKAEAEQALKDAGLTKYRIDPAPLDKYGYQQSYVKDHIVDCQPAPGQQVTVDTVIQLYYDSGDGLLPNVASYDRTRAVQDLTRAGFANVRTEEQESNAAAGTVISMDPAPNSQLPRDTQVTLWIAVPPTVPTDSPPETSPSDSASPTNGATP